ncbi:MAG TPA: hypothetical protein VN753_17020 [Terracidiphilus sp.]|nr:hypothetical protein [Terracidiphilus sp.]
MTHSITSTLSIAALGILAARASDLLRIPFTRREPCDDIHAKGAAWSYKADAAQRQSTWLRVQRHGTC